MFGTTYMFMVVTTLTHSIYAANDATQWVWKDNKAKSLNTKYQVYEDYDYPSQFDRDPQLRPEGILTGPVPSWIEDKPFKSYDKCKCTEKFNCNGLSYGHCDIGKQYCCYSRKQSYYPSRPVHDPSLGVLVGPEYHRPGPNRPVYNRPGPNRPNYNRPGFGLGPDGALFGPH